MFQSHNFSGQIDGTTDGTVKHLYLVVTLLDFLCFFLNLSFKMAMSERALDIVQGLPCG